jgi:hypothetical protein
MVVAAGVAVVAVAVAVPGEDMVGAEVAAEDIADQGEDTVGRDAARAQWVELASLATLVQLAVMVAIQAELELAERVLPEQVAAELELVERGLLEQVAAEPELAEWELQERVAACPLATFPKVDSIDPVAISLVVF